MHILKFVKIMFALLFAYSSTNCTSGESNVSNSPDALRKEVCEKRENNIKFPLKVKHQYGTTVIDKKPQRVAVYSTEYRDEDVFLALDVVPVAVSGISEEDAFPQWEKEKIQQLKAQNPVIINAPFKEYLQKLKTMRPDIIIISSSDLKNYKNYKALSKVAPTIPFPNDVVYSKQATFLCKMQFYSRILGMPKKEENYMKKVRLIMRKALNAHPILKRKRVIVAAVYSESGSISIGYSDRSDPRTGFLYDVGLPIPKAFKYQSGNATVSGPELSTYLSDIDVFVPYNLTSTNTKTIAALQADQYAMQIPAIKNGRIVQFNQNNKEYGYVSYSYPLSIPWGVNKYLDILEETAKK
jgi:fe3+-siderophore ABC superfamily ATP binding cassette transporter, binding protein